MSWRGLRYKGRERLTSAEWNAVVDSLNDLATMVRGGLASFTGDGTTTTFGIPHGLGTTPTSVVVVKGVPNIPDIDYVYADSTTINVVFKSPPPSGSEVKVWWLAFKALV
jgi:hypothetical protein